MENSVFSSLVDSLLNAYEEEISSIHTIRSPAPDKRSFYSNLLDKIEKYRGNALYYPYLGSGKGKGPFVELLDGSVKLDWICGVGPHFFGHYERNLKRELIKASLSDLSMQGNLQQNGDALELIERLSSLSGMSHVFLSTSGAMATENTLKIALQKNFPKQRIFAFSNCFMGRTLALSSITDRPLFRDKLPLLMDVDYIPFFDSADPDSIAKTLSVMDSHMKRYPNAHAALCMEPIQGEGGFYTAPSAFFKALIEKAKEHHIVTILDEVQAFARTEELFAASSLGILEEIDIIAIGKASQVCATLFRKELNPMPGLLSQTFTGSTASIRYALFLLEEQQLKNLYGPSGKIAWLQKECRPHLERLEKKGLIKGPFGTGSMLAFTPLDGSYEKVRAFFKVLFEKGVIGFIAGANPYRARFLLPAPVLEKEHIALGFEKIEEALLCTC